ncbi:hypothetical protein [Streptomyces sp. NPDC047981]|uniref:hypothetical protein n=1 Tax=Streptomyces sp. NPDC047981 TaxID=3154610 RepID=UPI00342DADD8
MRRTWRTAAVCGAAAVTLVVSLSVTGCEARTGTGSPAAPASPGAPATAASPAAPAAEATRGERGKFDRVAAQADLDAAASAAGLPDSGRSEGSPSPAPAGATEKERLKARAAACSARWGAYGRELAEAGDRRRKFDATVAELVARGWRVTTERNEEKLPDEGAVVITVLKKSGWSVEARHVTGALEMLVFQASEDACMNGFTEADWKLMMSADS